MNNLKLITTKTFNDNVPCDFWADINNEYFVTREQIGTALGYKDPRVAISKIHSAHKDRLDRFSTVTVLETVEGDRCVVRERILYSRKGIMEICRWSRQPLADKFMDWCWEIIDDIISNHNNTSMIINSQHSQIETLNQTINYLSSKQNTLIEQVNRLEIMITALLPPTQKSEWKSDISKKIKNIATQMGFTSNDSIRSIYGDIYRIMRTDYDMDVNKFKSEYIINHKDISNPPAIDIVSEVPELKKLFETILDNYIEIKTI